MPPVPTRPRPNRVFTAALAATCAATLSAGCGGGSTSLSASAPSAGAHGGDTQQSIINSAPTAAASLITPGSWAASVKKRGYLRVGGTDAGPVFSIKDPATGRLTGFDAGLSQLLAKYITGKSTNATKLSLTTVDTRETMLQNGTVDAVFATYTITPQRAQKVDFAGPYFESGDAIMTKKGNTTIKQVADLNGKTVATEGNSTAANEIKKLAPKAKVLLFQEDGECVAAVQQGRADAYVLDQGILLGDASANPSLKVIGNPFTKEPYGIGVPKADPSAKRFVDAWLKTIFANGEWAKLWQATIGKVVSGAPPEPPVIGSVPGS